MPYLVQPILRANEVLAQVDDFEPEPLLETIQGASTVNEAVEALGLFETLETDADRADLREFFDTIPASLDAAILAGVRSALERGVRTQVTWQPGYAFELRMWERSDGARGVVNLHILSPEPPERPRG